MRVHEVICFNYGLIFFFFFMKVAYLNSYNDLCLRIGINIGKKGVKWSEIPGIRKWHHYSYYFSDFHKDYTITISSFCFL